MFKHLAVSKQNTTISQCQICLNLYFYIFIFLLIIYFLNKNRHSSLAVGNNLTQAAVIMCGASYGSGCRCSLWLSSELWVALPSLTTWMKIWWSTVWEAAGRSPWEVQGGTPGKGRRWLPIGPPTHGDALEVIAQSISIIYRHEFTFMSAWSLKMCRIVRSVRCTEREQDFET